MIKTKKTIVTHSGTFHADDVFAVATLLLAHSEESFQIIRTRDEAVVSQGDFVVDVGGFYDGKKFFDHHQEGGAGVRENNLPYASFGLVWKEFGAEVCGGDFFVAKQIDDSLVSSMDAHDNGVKTYEELYSVSPFELSHYVSSFNPTWLEEEEWKDAREEKTLQIFENLVGWAREFILREIKRHKDKNKAFQLVKDAYAKSKDKRIIILDRYYPWQDALREYQEPVFVVYPQEDGKSWAAKTVPKDRDSFDSKMLFPASWAGKRDAELARETGVPDALFCHNKRFIATAKSREGAFALAKLTLAKSVLDSIR